MAAARRARPEGGGSWSTRSTSASCGAAFRVKAPRSCGTLHQVRRCIRAQVGCRCFESRRFWKKALLDRRRLCWRSMLPKQQFNGCRVTGSASQRMRYDLDELLDRCVGEKCEHLRPAPRSGTGIGFAVTVEELAQFAWNT